jgi:hypothetical protein
MTELLQGTTGITVVLEETQVTTTIALITIRVAGIVTRIT